MVRELDPFLVAGNHDWGVAGRLSLNYFNQQGAGGDSLDAQ